MGYYGIVSDANGLGKEERDILLSTSTPADWEAGCRVSLVSWRSPFCFLPSCSRFFRPLSSSTLTLEDLHFYFYREGRKEKGIDIEEIAKFLFSHWQRHRETLRLYSLPRPTPSHRGFLMGLSLLFQNCFHAPSLRKKKKKLCQTRIWQLEEIKIGGEDRKVIKIYLHFSSHSVFFFFSMNWAERRWKKVGC